MNQKKRVTKPNNKDEKPVGEVTLPAWMIVDIKERGYDGKRK